MNFKKKNIILAIIIIFIISILFIFNYKNSFSTVNKYYSSSNLNNFDPELITEANKSYNKPFKNNELKINKIIKIDGQLYAIIYNNKSYVILEKHFPSSIAGKISYYKVLTSQKFTCLDIKRGNIPFDLIENLSNFKCPPFSYNFSFSMQGQNPKYSTQQISITPQSAIIQNKPQNCTDLSLGIGCEFIKFQIDFTGLENSYVIFSKVSSSYFNKYIPSKTEELGDNINKTKYYTSDNELYAVNYCHIKNGICLGFEKSNDVNYFYDDTFGVDQFLLFKSQGSLIWDIGYAVPRLDGLSSIGGIFMHDNTLQDFILQKEGIPLPVISKYTSYLGKNNGMSCEEFKKLDPQAADTPENQLKFKCNYTYYTFAVPKEHMSFEGVEQSFIDGVDGFTLHGGAGDYYGSRFGSLSYIKQKNPVGMDDYYINIDNSNYNYVIYKVSYDPR